MADKYGPDRDATVLFGELIGADVPVAMAKCDAGDPAVGIPILEKALKDAKVNLPPRP